MTLPAFSCVDLLLQLQVLLSPERLRPVEHLPAVVDLLAFILQRDPKRRPTTSDIIARSLPLSYYSLGPGVHTHIGC